MNTPSTAPIRATDAEYSPELLALVDALAVLIGQLYLEGRLPEPAEPTNGSQK